MQSDQAAAQFSLASNILKPPLQPTAPISNAASDVHAWTTTIAGSESSVGVAQQPGVRAAESVALPTSNSAADELVSGEVIGTTASDGAARDAVGTGVAENVKGAAAD
eukprot:5145876-Pleurochrysis_carterae.AAC.1